MNPFRVLVTGSSGQLGSEIRLLANSMMSDGVFFFTDVSELDVTNLQQIRVYVKSNSINVIINCAAYTAVDQAESEEDKAYLVNALAPQYLAEVAKEFNCKFIHISTDYVFDGRNYRPYVETDVPNPLSVYGKTKLDGEELIKQVNPKHSIIVRTSWVYSSFGTNFVKTMRKLFQSKESLSIIYDQVGTPTYARDLAEAILKIVPQINNKATETYHYSNEGVISWFDFAQAILEMEGLTCALFPIRTEQYPTKATRPRYSVMDKAKIKEQFNLKIPYWRTSLQSALLHMKED